MPALSIAKHLDVVAVLGDILHRHNRRHRNVRRAAAHLKRCVRLQQMKVRADVVTVAALVAAGAARFVMPGVPRMIQAICFVAAALAAFTAYTDARVRREQLAELDELGHREVVGPADVVAVPRLPEQARLAH